MARSNGRGECLKYGCLGCVGIAGLGLAVVLVFFVGWLLIGRAAPEIETVEIRRAVADGREPGAPIAGTAERRFDREGVSEPGRIVLDLSMGRFEVLAGPAGEPIRVEGSYNAALFRLEESWGSYGEAGWIYRVSFGTRGMRWMFGSDVGQNAIKVIVPRQTPVVLEGRVGSGESSFELGGLRLLGTDLDLGVGEHRLSFDEPLTSPMERFELRGSIGETRVVSLGNASPRFTRVTHRIGEVDLDLEGAWQRDAKVELRCGIGSCSARVPREVAVTVSEAHVSIGQHDTSSIERSPARGPGIPSLDLAITGAVGEVRVR